jgi:hypothetical protein
MVSCGLNKISPQANDALEEPITMEELLAAVSNGKANKSPGHDGICNEFFQTAWEVIKHDMLSVMNQMYMDGTMTDTQKHGLIVCLSKKQDPGGTEDYRPVTLLNADYKIMNRIIANRLRPRLCNILQ